MSNRLIRRRSQASEASGERRPGSIRKRDISAPLPSVSQVSQYTPIIPFQSPPFSNSDSHYYTTSVSPRTPFYHHLPTSQTSLKLSHSQSHSALPHPPLPTPPVTPTMSGVARRPSVIKRKPVPVYNEDEFLPTCAHITRSGSGSGSSAVGSVVEVDEELEYAARRSAREGSDSSAISVDSVCEEEVLNTKTDLEEKPFARYSPPSEGRFTERFSVASNQLGQEVAPLQPRSQTTSMSSSEVKGTLPYPTYASPHSKLSSTSLSAPTPISPTKTSFLSRLSRSFSVSSATRHASPHPKHQIEPPLPIPKLEYSPTPPSAALTPKVSEQREALEKVKDAVNVKVGRRMSLRQPPEKPPKSAKRQSLLLAGQSLGLRV